MTAAILHWGPNELALGLLAAYALTGFAVAHRLGRRGVPSTTAVAAIAVWPLLVPLLTGPSAPATRSGPMSSRIEQVFAALHAVLAQTGTAELSDHELALLEGALHRADERLALVDGLLAQPIDASDGVGGSLGRLQQARAHAASEIEAVLAGLVELRLQVGLLTLSGGGSVRDQLLGLQSRMAALEEVNAVRRAAPEVA